jgi:hypothetical protein
MTSRATKTTLSTMNFNRSSCVDDAFGFGVPLSQLRDLRLGTLYRAYGTFGIWNEMKARNLRKSGPKAKSKIKTKSNSFSIQTIDVCNFSERLSTLALAKLLALIEQQNRDYRTTSACN